jgi:hypothetical protein
VKQHRTTGREFHKHCNGQEQWREEKKERETPENIDASLEDLKQNGSISMDIQFRIQKRIHSLAFFISELRWLRIDT